MSDVARLKDVIWKLEQQIDELGAHLELLRRATRYLEHKDDCALRYGDKVCDCRLSKLRLEIAEVLDEVA